MWISKQELRNKLMDARLESHREAAKQFSFIQESEQELQQEARIAKLEKQVKQLKKIIKEGW